jgi:hypothetical protein
MKKFGEKHLDVLQNIEHGIIEVYRDDASLIDMDAKDAIDALLRYYHAEEEGHTPPAMKLGERAQRVFANVQEICEWRLGRARLQGDSEVPMSRLPVADLVKALREIHKSIRRWTERNGRKGYLDFVGEYLP